MLPTSRRQRHSSKYSEEMKNVLLIYRAPQFSPNAVEKDKAILETVGELLRQEGFSVEYVHEEQLHGTEQADVCLSMGRLPATLDWLKRLSAEGCVTINSGRGVEQTARRQLDRLMREQQIPAAPLPSDGDDGGYWLKRGDAAAQSKEDVVFAATRKEMETCLQQFRQRGISEVVVTQHVPGDVVKFYGVQGTGFFRYFYPTDDGDTKFGDESRNGRACHYAFHAETLHKDAERLSVLTDVKVYGGDCIVRPDGTYALIDFNDWPSFSRCRAEAAAAIVRLVNHSMK